VASDFESNMLKAPTGNHHCPTNISGLSMRQISHPYFFAFTPVKTLDQSKSLQSKKNQETEGI
jgi:hypothetical protein